MRSFIFICLLLSAPVIAAKNPAEDLQRLKKEITSITAEINLSEQLYAKENRRLFDFDKQIAEALSQLARLEDQDKSLRIEIASVQEQAGKLKQETAESRQRFAELAKLYFISNETSYLKVLFSERQAGEIGRGPVYFSYLRESYEKSLKDLQEKTAIQEQNAQLLSQKLAAQEIVLNETRTKSELLQSKRQERTRFLARLDQQITDSKTKKQVLLSDQERLEKLLKEVEALARKAKKTSDGMGFATRKDGLDWPVEGKIVSNFGERRFSSGVKWHGLLIAAAAGESVRAIADGRVIFADWLNSFGYVVILDHGKNYLSLYGHNQKLAVELGENVRSGETIAEVGNSGRSGDPALYFEIRHKGKPVNPRRWLLARKTGN